MGSWWPRTVVEPPNAPQQQLVGPTRTGGLDNPRDRESAGQQRHAPFAELAAHDEQDQGDHQLVPGNEEGIRELVLGGTAAPFRTARAFGPAGPGEFEPRSLARSGSPLAYLKMYLLRNTSESDTPQ